MPHVMSVRRCIRSLPGPATTLSRAVFRRDRYPAHWLHGGNGWYRLQQVGIEIFTALACVDPSVAHDPHGGSYFLVAMPCPLLLWDDVTASP